MEKKGRSIYASPLDFSSQELFDFRHECIHILELAVNTRKPHIRYRVEILELFHNKLPDFTARDLSLASVINLRLDRVDKLLDPACRNRALMACPDDSALDLAAAERLPVEILFYDHERDHLHLLIGGESLPAGIAQSAPSDGRIIIDRSRIYYSGIVFTAIWTFHLSVPVLKEIRNLDIFPRYAALD